MKPDSYFFNAQKPMRVRRQNPMMAYVAVDRVSSFSWLSSFKKSSQLMEPLEQ